MPFIAGEDVLDRAKTGQCVVERQAGVAAQAEHGVDAVRLQHFDYRLRASQGRNLDRFVHATILAR